MNALEVIVHEECATTVCWIVLLCFWIVNIPDILCGEQQKDSAFVVILIFISYRAARGFVIHSVLIEISLTAVKYMAKWSKHFMAATQ